MLPRRFFKKGDYYGKEKENTNKDKMNIVQGEVCQDKLEWPQRSIIRETLKSMIFKIVADRLANE